MNGGRSKLNITVIIRSVVDCLVPLPADIYGEKPAPEGMAHIINPADWFALEQALLISAGNGCKEVTAISLGGGEAEEGLRWCLAAGARQAIRIWDEALAGADALGKGKALAAALVRSKPDLALCGDGCLDQLNTELPGMAAAMAGMTYVPGAAGLEKAADGKVVVIRRAGKGRREKVLVRLPALVALEGGGRPPACDAALPDLISAFALPVPCYNLADLGLSVERYGSQGVKVHGTMVRVPVPVTVRPFTPDPRMPAEQRLRAILAGTTAKRQGEVVTGTPEQLSDRIVQFLQMNL